MFSNIITLTLLTDDIIEKAYNINGESESKNSFIIAMVCAALLLKFVFSKMSLFIIWLTALQKHFEPLSNVSKIANLWNNFHCTMQVLRMHIIA